MRRSSRLVVALLAGGCTVAIAFGQTTPTRGKPATKRSAPDPAVEQEKNRKLQAILSEWEKQSAGLSSLDIRFTREDVSPGWDENGPTQYRGQAHLQSPDRAFLRFEKLERDKGRERYVIHEDIICTGKHVLQYAYPTRQIFVFPLPKEARGRILDEGPLPFLFNMHAKELQERFLLKLGRETQDAYLIEVHPLKEYDQESFVGAHLWLNKQTLLPDKLRFTAPNGKDYKTYTLGGMHTNPQFEKTHFQGKRLEGWTIVENPGPDPSRPPAAARMKRAVPR